MLARATCPKRLSVTGLAGGAVASLVITLLFFSYSFPASSLEYIHASQDKIGSLLQRYSTVCPMAPRAFSQLALLSTFAQSYSRRAGLQQLPRPLSSPRILLHRPTRLQGFPLDTILKRFLRCRSPQVCAVSRPSRTGHFLQRHKG